MIDNTISEYDKLSFALNKIYDEVDGLEFYNEVFPNNQNKGEINDKFQKPNAIYLYKDAKDTNSERTLRRRIMLKDVWFNDYHEFVAGNQMALCSGLAYRGRINRLEHAQNMNALIFDLDSVGFNEFKTLLLRMGKKPGLRTVPQPTYIVMSGTGLHLYYVLKNPIALYPNIKIQMKSLKYDLTFKIWDYKSTTREKRIQYQSINQGFRMVGSTNEKYNLEVKAFKTGEKVSLEYLNSYVDQAKNQVDLNKPFKPTQYTLKEAEEKFPEWYDRVIIKKDKRAKKWDIKRDLYDWWLRQSFKVKGGHRYYYLMAMAIYAVKCNIPKKELKADMYKVFEELKAIEHSHPLSKQDIKSALETYDRQYYNFTIDDIVKLTDIQIDKNKRNYKTQAEHVEVMNFFRDKFTHPNGQWRNINGRPNKKNLVEEFIKANPKANPTEIARGLDVSRTTVYKYLEEIEVKKNEQ